MGGYIYRSAGIAKSGVVSSIQPGGGCGDAGYLKRRSGQYRDQYAQARCGAKRGMQMLWMAVTADEYELPLCVTDTAAELAAKYNTTKSNVTSSICAGKTGRYRGYKFVRVKEIDDE